MKEKQTDKAKQLLDKAMKRSPKNTEIFRAVASITVKPTITSLPLPFCTKPRSRMLT